jgi:hypothetical protein
MGWNIALRGGAMGDHDTDLGNGYEVRQLAAWIESLPAEGYQGLKTFTGAGPPAKTSAISEELERALEEHRPTDPITFRPADRFADLLGVGDPNETVTLEQ